MVTTSEVALSPKMDLTKDAEDEEDAEQSPKPTRRRSLRLLLLSDNDLNSLRGAPMTLSPSLVAMMMKKSHANLGSFFFLQLSPSFNMAFLA